jgi:geranyl-CoA carboxylase alpha subunit
VEHALESGLEISPFYDSMIAKIIASGATREQARSRLICALEQTAAFGLTTNQAFLMSCLRNPAFASGNASTAFVEKYRETLLGPRKPTPSEVALAALLLYVTNPYRPPWRSGRTLAATFLMPTRIELDGHIHDLEIVRERDGGYVASLAGRDHRFEIDELGRDGIRFRANGLTQSAKFLRDRDGKVRAAMTGRVVAILVKPGEIVSAGQPVMTLEAMKMEHVHAAPVAGIVSAIDVSEGEQVTIGKIAVEIEAAARTA